MDDALFACFGQAATVERAGSTASLVLIVRDGVARLGEFQQVIGRARQVLARNRQWVFLRGDRVSLEGHTWSVEAVVENDGWVNEAVLHG